MRLLVTGGAGFIGSHFVKGMLAAGEDVVVLDKFTYAGNPANLPAGIDCHRGDIATRQDVDQIGPVDAIVNFAAETHVDRSILGPEDFVRTDVLGTLVLRVEGGWRPAGARSREDVRCQRIDHARLEHVWAQSVSGEGAAALRDERSRRRASAALR